MKGEGGPPIAHCPLPIARSQMEILYFLIPLSVVLVFVVGGIFWWSVRSGQFDDLEGPAYRILQDKDKGTTDEPPLPFRG